MAQDPVENILIETQRLKLKPIQKTDFEDLCLLDSDPAVRVYFPEGALNVDQIKSELDRFIVEWQTVGFGMFSVVEKSSQQFIGRSGFAKLQSGIVEFGYLLLKEYWGQGYATEASKALLEWGAKNIPVDHIVGFAPEDHVASRRVLEKCGMEYDRMDVYQGIVCVFYNYKVN
jgi:RimJ/RimL family protein N-acetyltransferase